MTGFIRGKWRALLLEPLSLIPPRQSSTQCDEVDQAAKIMYLSRACILPRYERRGNGWVVIPQAPLSVAAGPQVSDLGPGLLGRCRPQQSAPKGHASHGQSVVRRRDGGTV